MRRNEISTIYASATARRTRADRVRGGLIDRVAVGSPIGRLLFVEAPGHVRMPAICVLFLFSAVLGNFWIASLVRFNKRLITLVLSARFSVVCCRDKAALSSAA